MANVASFYRNGKEVTLHCYTTEDAAKVEKMLIDIFRKINMDKKFEEFING